jgi:hypothetical protein
MTASVLVLGFSDDPLSADQERTGSRFAYLDEREPYYPGLDFPKLTTPMWVGEPGVDAVVLLSIDDMRDPEHYERYLRPILNRSREIDARAPVSVFACQVVPTHPRLQQFVDEGLSIEVHTVTHPCPLLRGGEGKPVGEDTLRPAVRDVVDCLDNMNRIAGNTAVAYRMPCCDSRNTVSPRFYTEVFPRRTINGHFLQADSSIFVLFTAADRALKREWVLDPDGRERFRKYLPFRNYALTIENYPYPYVVDRRIWEFPCIVPSDWAAQNLHKPNHPQTVADWKAALDVVVAKQGIFTLVFHPHNWIKPEQIVELIDYVDSRYGKRVKFLNFREAVGRLTQNLLAGQPLRSATGQDNGVRLADVNADGFLDVLIGNSARRETRVWEPVKRTWKTCPLPVAFVANESKARAEDLGVRFFSATQNGHAALAVASTAVTGCWQFVGQGWKPIDLGLPRSIADLPVESARRVFACAAHPHQLRGGPGHCPDCGADLQGRTIDGGVRFRDVDGDGLDELLINNDRQNAVYERRLPGGWQQAPFALPAPEMLVNSVGADQGSRFVDLDGDGDEDLVHSNEREFSVYRFESSTRGWATCVRSGRSGTPGALPPITVQGALFGAWFHSRAMYVANEGTAKKPDLVEKILFSDIIRPTP